jgi:hypothetical protein
VLQISKEPVTKGMASLLHPLFTRKFTEYVLHCQVSNNMMRQKRSKNKDDPTGISQKKMMTTQNHSEKSLKKF